MTDQKQRIAIAEACGWTSIQCGDTEFPNFLVGLPPGKTRILDGRQIPNYLRSLDDMHEAEMAIINKGNLGWDYCNQLNLITGAFKRTTEYLSVIATARQRAEAFLRTIGKWKE